MTTIKDQVYNQVNIQAYYQVENEVWNQVYHQIKTQVQDQIRHQVYMQFEEDLLYKSKLINWQRIVTYMESDLPDLMN